MQQSYLIIASKNAVYVQINVHPKPHEICTFCPFFYISLYPTSLLPKVLTRWVGLPPHTGSAASALRQLSALPHRLDHNQPAGPGQSMFLWILYIPILNPSYKTHIIKPKISALPHRLDHNQPAGPGQSMSPQHMRALNKLPLGLLVIGGEGGTLGF